MPDVPCWGLLGSEREQWEGDLRSYFNITGSITTNPSINLYLVANLASEKLVHRYVQPPTLQIPQCDVNAGQGGHENGPTAIEAQPPDSLPDVLDVTTPLALK